MHKSSWPPSTTTSRQAADAGFGQIELKRAESFHIDTLSTPSHHRELPAPTGRMSLMLGAHFDSWHAVPARPTMACRLGAMMERSHFSRLRGFATADGATRFVDRRGAGLLGSREYVKQQFGDPETMG